MNAEWKFSEAPGEPLCVYDGTQESADACVAVMCKNLGIDRDVTGKFPGEMIMVALWARILQLQGHADSGIHAHDGGNLWARGEKT